MSSVRAFRLVTGEEIITRVESETTDTYTLERPMVLNLVPVQGQKGQAAPMVFPWIFSHNEPKFVLNKSAVMGEIVNVHEEIEHDYMQKTSRIQLVKQ